ncbi:MAG: hypothetical protein M1819_005566 [Sarea resinae]|nr:MAG: hypothetical protein M1819_005566 [Sarea resinae]
MLPAWTREATPSIRSSASRASSIISTHTKTSINTLQDPGSDVIEVPVGHLLYRLRADGHILSVLYDPPPPPFEPGTFGLGEEPPEAAISGPGPESISVVPPVTPLDSPDRGYSSREVGQLTSSPPGVSRTPSFTPGNDSISVDRRRASTSSGDVSQANTPETEPSCGISEMKLRRRNGVKLKLVTRSGGRLSSGTSPASSAQTPSSSLSPSGHPLSHQRLSPGLHDQEPGSPAFIGRGATGTFPSPIGKGSIEPLGINSITAFSSPFNPRDLENDADGLGEQPNELDIADVLSSAKQQGKEGYSTPRTDNETEIANHYRELVRILDEKHNREIEARDHEIAETRGMMRALTKEAFELKMKSAGADAERSRNKKCSEEVARMKRVLTENKKMINALSEENIELKERLEKTEGGVKANSPSTAKHVDNTETAPLKHMPRTTLGSARGMAIRSEEQASKQDPPLPPLKRSHIRTLKNSMKRRAEKLKNRGSAPDSHDTSVTGFPLPEYHRPVNVENAESHFSKGNQPNVAQFPARSDLDSWDEAMLQNETHWYTHQLVSNLERASNLLDQRRRAWRRVFLRFERTMRSLLQQDDGDWRRDLTSLAIRMNRISAQEVFGDQLRITEIVDADREVERKFRERWGTRAEQVGIIVQMRLSLFGRLLATQISDHDDDEHDHEDESMSLDISKPRPGKFSSAEEFIVKDTHHS